MDEHSSKPVWDRRCRAIAYLVIIIAHSALFALFAWMIL